jgi:hypothetical protein
MQQLVDQADQRVPFWITVEEFEPRTSGSLQDALELLQQFVEKGDSVPYQSPQRPRTAASLRWFLAEMIEYSIKNQYHELTVQTFHAVHKKLCPLFPFWSLRDGREDKEGLRFRE